MRRALLNCCSLLDGLGVAAWLGFLGCCKDHPAAAVVLFFAGLGLMIAAGALFDTKKLKR